MNYHNHTDQVAVAVCTDCNRGLCSYYLLSYSIPSCLSCGSKGICIAKWSIIKTILLSLVMGLVVMFLLGAILFTPGDEHKFTFFSFYLLLFYISCGIVLGRKALTGITPNMFLILPLIGWVFYFILKTLLALAIGWIILPFKMAKDIMQFV